MTLLAAISEGNADTGDWFFLFAVILAVLTAILYAARRPAGVVWAPVSGALALACLSVGFLVL